MPTKKIIKDSRGISPAISTIIISGTLLIILVIASFVSGNILELQIASTEFEQAKTNMMLLDEVTQDVALRRGAGGYVQFNQRSGGIGITENTEKIKITGPGQQTYSATLTLKPNVAGTDQAWATFGSGSAHWDRTSDVNDATGVQVTGSTTLKETENLQDTSQTGTINSVTAYIRAKVSGGGGTVEKACILWRTYSTDHESADFDISRTAFADYSQTRTMNPNTGVAWTWAEINALQIGSRATTLGSSEAIQVSEFWIVVDYTSTQADIIYESPNLMSLVYRGGSHVPGSGITLRGNNSPIVSMTNALGYLRVETGQGIQIKLDYHRVRIVEMGTLLVNGTLHNFIEITFLRLKQGNMGGSGTVNVKVQNTDVDTITRTYDGGSVTIQVQLGLNPPKSHPISSAASKTVVMFTEILVQFSTA